MMKNCKEDFLENLCELITDGSHFSPPSQEEGYYMASVKDMGDYNFDFSDCRKISKEDYEKLFKSNCSPKNNDILIAKDGSPLSNIFVYTEEFPMVILSSITIIRADSSKILPKFLKYYLENKAIKHYIQSSYTSGSVIPRIILKDFKKFSIQYPSIENQIKIISVLESLDKKIELNKKINQNLESLAENVFKNWFVDCAPFKSKDFKETKWGLVPKNWKEIEFGDLIYVTTGKRPNIKSVNKTEEFKYPIYGASSIMGYVDEYLFDEDIFIIGRVGTHGIVQRVNCKSFPSDNTLVIKLKLFCLLKIF